MDQKNSDTCSGSHDCTFVQRSSHICAIVWFSRFLKSEAGAEVFNWEREMVSSVDFLPNDPESSHGYRKTKSTGAMDRLDECRVRLDF